MCYRVLHFTEKRKELYTENQYVSRDIGKYKQSFSTRQGLPEKGCPRRKFPSPLQPLELMTKGQDSRRIHCVPEAIPGLSTLLMPFMKTQSPQKYNLPAPCLKSFHTLSVPTTAQFFNQAFLFASSLATRWKGDRSAFTEMRITLTTLI